MVRLASFQGNHTLLGVVSLKPSKETTPFKKMTAYLGIKEITPWLVSKKPHHHTLDPTTPCLAFFESKAWRCFTKGAIDSGNGSFGSLSLKGQRGIDQENDCLVSKKPLAVVSLKPSESLSKQTKKGFNQGNGVVSLVGFKETTPSLLFEKQAYHG